MATSSSSQKSTTEQPATPELADDARDVVAMPSLKADRSTPDQTPGYGVLAKDGTAADAAEYDDPRKV